ncbi:MAG: ATP phosphoribosyltransferase regulatory subunit [Rhodospirillaceae bacterium]|jgi:ATP phosphoribosyltransferase regulatory subunit|nr:ATP phosphoribosyltransferase regulatory subunit [Rhodospirillaceae bacterium]MBT4588775.1 ATP phosphoribosyltransferase regulatory subunit [Rhodospirillaceae bacterium]MBT4938983.1 ATP phosphoribosyltransferase regulatory subunit [Rhodospirillaceae bacterium]MBT5940180.1 ATP phosphoribosyltransferase regulatory subunit [Rhodospirillaceae bacterium]MBT7267754.1 ATP phosphoribosyltransferase regulatory subunit [Rhodospirillaceae bacterium]
MTDDTHRGLLPTGLADILPPEAEFEARVTESLMASFASYGYERVKPPLIEFEEILLSGSGSTTAKQTFRMMDPISQRMLGVRADMTLQIARIASTRLGDVPRPIRLSYAGQVLRVKGSDLRPKRQFGQIGAELIGSLSPQADAEVVLMAAEALTDLGVPNLSVDLGLPTLVTAICSAREIDLSAEGSNLRASLNQKDAPAIEALSEKLGDETSALFGTLLKAVGPADKALAILQKCPLPENAKAELANLAAVIECLKDRAPNLTLTIDPVETRGYEYHTGVTFTFFALDVRGEIGRGGRYLAEDTNGGDSEETATGVSLFIDTILRALPDPTQPDRVYVPASTPGVAQKLRQEDWIVVESFDDGDMEQAKLAGCSHYWDGSQVTPVTNS